MATGTPQVWTAVGHARQQLELERKLMATSDRAWTAADSASDNGSSEQAENARNRASDTDWYVEVAHNALDMLDVDKAKRALATAEAHANAAEAHAEGSDEDSATTAALEAEQLV